MGRKALSKDRQVNHSKMEQWANALFPFFQEHGLKGITIDQMAEWIKKSKSTLYQYFSSKEEIIQLSLGLKLKTLLPYKEILEDETKPHPERFEAFLAFIAESISDISGLFLSDLKEDYQDIWKIIDQFLFQLLEVCESFYKSAIDSGAFAARNVALMVELDRHFIFDLLLNPNFLKENQLSLSQLTIEYLELRMEGLKKK